MNFCKKEKESRGWREAKTGGIAGWGPVAGGERDGKYAKRKPLLNRKRKARRIHRMVRKKKELEKNKGEMLKEIGIDVEADRKRGKGKRKIETGIEEESGIQIKRRRARERGGVSHCRIAPSPTRFHLYRFAILRVFCAVALG